MTASTIIVAIQNKVLRAFRDAGATSADSARTLEELGLRESSIFRSFVGRNVVHRTEDGRYWMAEGAAEEFLALRRRRLWIAVAED